MSTDMKEKSSLLSSPSQWERRAQWLRRRTLGPYDDKGSGFDSHNWGKVPGRHLTQRCLYPPSSNGYLVEREKNGVNGIKPLPLYAAWLHSPQGDDE